MRYAYDRRKVAEMDVCVSECARAREVKHMCECVRVHACSCMRTFAHIRLRACVRAGVRACVREYQKLAVLR